MEHKEISANRNVHSTKYLIEKIGKISYKQLNIRGSYRKKEVIIYTRGVDNKNQTES